jgi:hypothetical protein
VNSKVLVVVDVIAYIKIYCRCWCSSPTADYLPVKNTGKGMNYQRLALSCKALFSWE